MISNRGFYVCVAAAAVLGGDSVNAASVSISEVVSLSFSYSDTTFLSGQLTSSASSGNTVAGGGVAVTNATVTPDTGGVPTDGLITSLVASSSIEVDDGGQAGASASASTTPEFTYQLVYGGLSEIEIDLELNFDQFLNIENPLFASLVDGLYLTDLSLQGGLDEFGNEFFVASNQSPVEFLSPTGSFNDVEAGEASVNFNGSFIDPGIILNSDFNTLTVTYSLQANALVDAGPAAPIPLPAAAWMLLAGLGALGVIARRRV
ncbi:MAG: VPLPA-CTERM sorting domain-containing protein [Pseudomonadota bacterium]